MSGTPNLDDFMQEQSFKCPYNPTHKMLLKNKDEHLRGCRIMYPKLASRMSTCAYSPEHRIPEIERLLHEEFCAVRLAGPIHVPEFTAASMTVINRDVDVEENWDDDIPVDRNVNRRVQMNRKPAQELSNRREPSRSYRGTSPVFSRDYEDNSRRVRSFGRTTYNKSGSPVGSQCSDDTFREERIIKFINTTSHGDIYTPPPVETTRSQDDVYTPPPIATTRSQDDVYAPPPSIDYYSHYSQNKSSSHYDQTREVDQSQLGQARKPENSSEYNTDYAVQKPHYGTSVALNHDPIRIKSPFELGIAVSSKSPGPDIWSTHDRPMHSRFYPPSSDFYDNASIRRDNQKSHPIHPDNIKREQIPTGYYEKQSYARAVAATNQLKNDFIPVGSESRTQLPQQQIMRSSPPYNRKASDTTTFPGQNYEESYDQELFNRLNKHKELCTIGMQPMRNRQVLMGQHDYRVTSHSPVEDRNLRCEDIDTYHAVKREICEDDYIPQDASSSRPNVLSQVNQSSTMDYYNNIIDSVKEFGAYGTKTSKSNTSCEKVNVSAVTEPSVSQYKKGSSSRHISTSQGNISDVHFYVPPHRRADSEPGLQKRKTATNKSTASNRRQAAEENWD